MPTKPSQAKPGWIINVSLQLQNELMCMAVGSIERGMTSICADYGGSLLSALHWYRAQGEHLLQVAVTAPSLFWLPLHLLARS